VFSVNSFKDRAIIRFGHEDFGVGFTHWGRKRRSWSMRWQDILRIDAMVVEVPLYGFQLRLLFLDHNTEWRFVADDMENWDAFEQSIRMRIPPFNWANIEQARRYLNRGKRFSCFERSS